MRLFWKRWRGSRPGTPGFAGSPGGSVTDVSRARAACERAPAAIVLLVVRLDAGARRGLLVVGDRAALFGLPELSVAGDRWALGGLSELGAGGRFGGRARCNGLSGAPATVRVSHRLEP